MPSEFRFHRLRLRSFLSAFAFLAVSLMTAADVAAQAEATTGVIRGVVRDPTGSGVAGAAVLIVHRETGLQATVETTSSGTFIRTLLPVGTYDVTARALGQFGDEQIQGLILRLGETLDLVLEFKPVALSEITISGEQSPLVDTEESSSSQRLDGEVVDALPNNGRNFLDLTLLTPGVQVSQGPDGDVLNIGGQRGIFNNVVVDGADFNNPFFGEQRGGQRPAFTFNQDAVEEVVVVSQGAPAEFGRSSGGFVNVLTKSGTNEFQGSAHYFGQWDGISATYPSSRGGGKPEFNRGQFGFTLGGPIVRDKAFFFVAYDQQDMSETKQQNRVVQNDAELQKLNSFLQTEWPGLFTNEFGPITRTDDNRALIAKLDYNLSDRHQASVKYNYTWSQQVNGTFDVDAWGLSANGIEESKSHAVNGSLRSQLSNTVSNEFRIQYAREDRPRAYSGPLIPGATPPAPPSFGAIGGRPFPDIGMDFADGFRIGLPFFLPIDPGYDTRLQIVDNVTKLAGDHLFKAGFEYNRTTVEQQFVGFSNGLYKFNDVDGFINFVQQGNLYVTCSDGSDSALGVCPDGTEITGPVDLYLQAATVGSTPQDQLGLQSFSVSELAFFIQDTWQPRSNLTLNMGVRWEGAWHPDVFVKPEDTFYAPWLSDARFPSDGTIPNDLNNFQPRFGLAWDPADDGRMLVRANAGSYFARIPMLVFAQHRTANGAFQTNIFRSSAESGFLGPVPAIDELIDPSGQVPFQPGVQVADKNLQLPRTWSFSAGVERYVSDVVAASVNYQHARTDNLFRFVNRNAAELGAPFAAGAAGLGDLTTTESLARSRYNAVTVGLKGQGALNGRVSFDANYTLAFDKSDDDNERDPFTFRYADASNLMPEYGWSDRDRRHAFNTFVLVALPGDVLFNNIVRYASASPVSEDCSNAGQRAASPGARICSDGSILTRNTLRRDNEFFTWDLRFSKSFQFGSGQTIEPILEIFNLTNADNFLDTAQGSLLFNFDGTIRSGLGDTRRAQLGVRFRF